MKSRKDIQQLIESKGSAAIAVFEQTKAVFGELKVALQEIEREFKQKMMSSEPRIPLAYDDKGRLEVHFTFAEDVLVFLMHTNVFTFDPRHPVMKTSYIKEDPMRAFFGMIYVYNFLYESVKYNRHDDYGILVGRMLVNREGHFIVEGKRQIGLLFNDFTLDKADGKKIRQFIEALMQFVLEIDIRVPPFDSMQQTTLQEIIDSSSHTSVISGKRFGFVLPGSESEG